MNSRRPAILALTAFTTLTASGCGVGIHFADYRHTVTPADTHLTDKVSAVNVSANTGHVTVTPGGTGITVHRVVHYQSGTPHPSQHISGGTLTFTTGCSRCRVDYDLTVPASVRVFAHTDSGPVSVAGVAGVDARSDSGSIRLRDIAGAATARSDSGRIIASNVRGAFEASSDSGAITATALHSPTATVSSDSGSLHLTFADAPSSVKTESDSGSTHLALPGGPYLVDARTDSGGRHINVPTDPSASAKLSLRSDSGSVTVDPAR